MSKLITIPILIIAMISSFAIPWLIIQITTYTLLRNSTRCKNFTDRSICDASLVISCTPMFVMMFFIYNSVETTQLWLNITTLALIMILTLLAKHASVINNKTHGMLKSIILATYTIIATRILLTLIINLYIYGTEMLPFLRLKEVLL